MKRLRTSTCPSATAGSSISPKAKFSSVGQPLGREASRNSRLFAIMSVLSRGSGAGLANEAGESSVGFSQSFQQRRGRPKLAVLPLKLADTIVNAAQSDGVGVPHWTTPVSGEAVSIDVDDVDVHRAQCVALFQDASPFVHQRVDAPLHNLLRWNLALRNPRFRRPTAHQVSDGRIRNRTAVLVVRVPAGAGLLSVASELAKTIGGEGLSHARLLQMAIFLANAPTHIQTGEIACGQRSHGHPEIVKRLVDSFHTGSFLNQECRFTNVRMEHAVADEAATVADQHSDFSQLLGQLHAGGNHFFAAGAPAHDLQQPHHVCWAEEMGPNYGLRTRSGG